MKKIGGNLMLMLIILSIQYLFTPIAFILTFILPIAFFFVNRRYIWYSILLTVLVDLVINWDYFMYYESRYLIIVFTLAQIAVMAIIILILKAITAKRKK